MVDTTGDSFEVPSTHALHHPAEFKCNSFSVSSCGVLIALQKLIQFAAKRKYLVTSISGVAVEEVRLEVNVKFADSRSNIYLVMGRVHFVIDNQSFWRKP